MDIIYLLLQFSGYFGIVFSILGLILSLMADDLYLFLGFAICLLISYKLAKWSHKKRFEYVKKASVNNPFNASNKLSMNERLEELDKLAEEGLITQTEKQTKKDEILGQYMNTVSNSPKNKTNYEQIKDLKLLLDEGYITKDEYEFKRKTILGL